MLHQFRRELHAFQYILARYGGILLQDIFNRISRAEKLQYSLCRDPCAPDHGLSVADIWVDGDSIHTRQGEEKHKIKPQRHRVTEKCLSECHEKALVISLGCSLCLCASMPLWLTLVFHQPARIANCEIKSKGIASFTAVRCLGRSHVFRPNNLESQPIGHLI